MQRLTTIAIGVTLLAGCANSKAQKKDDQPQVQPQLQKQPPLPLVKAEMRPAKAMVAKLAGQCYDRGLAFDKDFPKSAKISVAWKSDRRGYLLHVAFPIDSLRGENISATQTFADCVVEGLRTAKLIWPREGSVGMRLTPP